MNPNRRDRPEEPAPNDPHAFPCFCGTVAARPALTGGRFRVLRCVGCGACRTDPPPLEPPAAIPELVEGHRRHPELFRRLLSDVLHEALRYRSEGRLLDVGCSVGHLLDLASERGFDVTGIELEPLAVRYARERFGDRILDVPLERAGLPPASYDVITLNDVLEHVARPIELLGEIRTLLRPEGVVVVGTPNFGGWASRIEGTRWTGLQPEGHVWQFSPRSLVDCLRRAGLRSVRVRTNQLHRKWSAHWRHRLRKLVYDASVGLGRGDGLLVTAVRDGSP